MDIDGVLALLDGVVHRPTEIAARCPAHDDHVQSLTVNEGRHGNIVVKCHVTCTQEQVVAAMGLSLADLMGKPYRVCEYPYVDLDGAVRYTKERWANPKTFRYQGSLPPPAERILYNWACVPWAKANDRVVLWVEGEKDVDNCSARGIPSVTTCEGAGSGILPQYVEALRDVDVIVVGDDDPVGREYAREKARKLNGVARSVRLTRSKYGNDLSDAFEAGYELDQALDDLQEFEDVPSYVAKRVRTRKVDWAWQRYFPLGKLALIEGDPGDGKSILTIDLAARWSTGTAMPDKSNGFGPASILMVSAEDDPEDTLVPRLVAAGADLERVHLMPHGVTPDVPFTFRDGLAAVTKLVQRKDIKVIFFDPLMAFMSADTDTHNDASVRRALQPLKTLASNTGAVVVVVRHLNKGSVGQKAIYRGGGSIAFTGAVRATYVVSPHHDDPSTRVFAPVKNNLTKLPPSLTYTIEVTQNELPYLRWGDAIEMTAQEAIDGPRRGTASEAGEELKSRRKARSLAGEFLLDVVFNGPKSWAEIVEAGKSEGISGRTLERARAEVGLTRITGSGGQATTTWARPEHPPSPPLRHFATKSGLSTMPQNVGEMAERAPEPEQLSDKELDQKRDQELAEAELACDICGETIYAYRFGKPYWLVRCKPHDPRYYGGTNDTKEMEEHSPNNGGV